MGRNNRILPKGGSSTALPRRPDPVAKMGEAEETAPIPRELATAVPTIGDGEASLSAPAEAGLTPPAEAGQESLADAFYPRRHFRVSLKSYGPTSEHEAESEEEAWRDFKRRHGIIDSEHAPEITELHPELAEAGK